MALLLPDLSVEGCEDTRATLHLWTQIVGKLRLALAPMINHWWQVPFYVSPRGLTTSAIPYESMIFEAEFDFIDHALHIRTSENTLRTIRLCPRSVADFYAEFMVALKALGIDVKLWAMPVEIPDAIPFEQDHTHASYDPEYVGRLWRALVFSDGVLKEFRGRFIGKHSPVHFFWGSFDLASTRFSGRPAPERQWPAGLEKIMREAYSHEVSSAGFWAGDASHPPLFYAYHTPETDGYRTSSIQPSGACFHEQLGEFVLMYHNLRHSADPKADLLAFLQTTYEAGANCAGWDRQALERPNSN